MIKKKMQKNQNLITMPFSHVYNVYYTLYSQWLLVIYSSLIDSLPFKQDSMY